MIKLIEKPVFVSQNGEIFENCSFSMEEARKNTMAYRILEAHNHSGNMKNLKLKFDALVSPDNNYVNILQTARATGIKEFPVPYVLSNCHHTLCAVGGTINEDDHVFGLDNAKKYGGIFLPPYRAVLHQYMREAYAGGGKMILGSDSHSRYGALGTMGIGEGGGEVAKQLLGKTYDIKMPEIVAVKLTGKPKPGIGPMDVALTLIGAAFKSGFTKNKVLEFIGDGIGNLSVEFRMGIDVMTTESAALSSIWCTDKKVREYLKLHNRENEYAQINLDGTAYYDALIEINLSEVECMMALPFHPSNVVSIREFKADPYKYIKQAEEEGQRIKGESKEPFVLTDKIVEGELYASQALISGCSGGMFENICAAADILAGHGIAGDKISLGINPSSQPVYVDLVEKGIVSELAVAGATMRPAICGPCFGVTDVPANNQISIRHMTRNYPNREGSKPDKGQMAAAILMDARSIAATVRNGGKITAATELDVSSRDFAYQFNSKIYENQVYNNYKKGDPETEIRMGPNISDWPKMYPLGKHLLLQVAGAYKGSVTTDDLIPSGDASSYRSNPHKISEYTLINKDPDYVKSAKAVQAIDEERRAGSKISDTYCAGLLQSLCEQVQCSPEDITIGSVIISDQIGDGSSREQAASCQKVLGGYANITNEFATKRYRSNLINWGILPLITQEELNVPKGSYLFIQDIKELVKNPVKEVQIQVLNSNKTITCSIGNLTEDEKMILLEGCIINFYTH